MLSRGAVSNYDRRGSNWLDRSEEVRARCVFCDSQFKREPQAPDFADLQTRAIKKRDGRRQTRWVARRAAKILVPASRFELLTPRV